MKINKLVGLSLAMMLGFGVVGCGDTEIEEEQQVQQEEQYQEEEKEVEQEQPKEEYVEPQEEQPKIQDEDVSDYYIQNRQKTDLEIAKEDIEQTMRENDIQDWIVEINEENDLIIIYIPMSSETVAYGISSGEWSKFIGTSQSMSSNMYTYFKQQGMNVNIGVIVTDGENAYLSVLNGEVVYNVENELN